MPTRKAQRRTIARGLKYTGLPLPIRGRLAKLILAGDDYLTGEVLSDVGCTVVRTWGCDCCDPYAHQEWEYKGKHFCTEYGRLDRALTEKSFPRVSGPAKTPIDPGYQARKRLSDYRVSIKKARAVLSNLESSERKLATDLVKGALGDRCPSDLEHGTWECNKSPTGLCAYNDSEDSCHDSCIFCGDPEERK